MQNHLFIQHYTPLAHETVGLLIHLTNQEWLTNKLIQELYFKHNTLTEVYDMASKYTMFNN